MEEKKKVLTTSTGRRIDSNQNSLTAGERGPILLSDFYLLEKMAAFDHERAPERVVHAKGAGAHGYFEVTHDISKYCKAKIFNKIGKRTPAFVRFSTVIGERGTPDTWRDPRGFAIKFYTEEGNWDLVCNNTPVFFVRDPLKFFDFIHSQKRNPQTNLKDHDAYWDFLSLTPESIHQITYMFGGRGTPDGYRHMNGYGSHTFKMVNSNHEVFYVKFHVKSDAGIHNLKWPAASKLAEDNPDYSTHDLYDHIAKGNEASWTFYIQVMPFAEGEGYKWDIFDVTKVWPHSDYPLIPVGKLVLNRNPINYFQEVEQSAFNPASMVEGIEPSNDKMLQARLFSYQDTQRHRIGPNFTQIPINCPYATKVATLNRDGPMRYDGNHGNEPAYEPNSIEGTPREAPNAKMHEYEISGKAGRFGFNHPNDDFEQATTLFRKVMDDAEREDLISNLVAHMKMVTKKEILERQCEIFYRCDPEYGTRVAQGLGITPPGSKTSEQLSA